MKRILVVEDEPGMQMMLRDALVAEGYEVDSASDGDEALVRSGAHDLVVLDLMLPKKNGLDVCRELRQRGSSIPILMLTARGETADRVIGLKLGADDYLVKPFAVSELLARIEALLRRPADMLSTWPDLYSFGDVSVDFRRVVVTRRGMAVRLTALELRLLRFLVDRAGEVVSRDRLLDAVWGYHTEISTRTVDVHVASLRKKLESVPANPRHILSVRGIGYRFVP